eukprot:1348517-Amorphochlora_amoeboformis.AAC.3
MRDVTTLKSAGSGGYSAPRRRVDVTAGKLGIAGFTSSSSYPFVHVGIRWIATSPEEETDLHGDGDWNWNDESRSYYCDHSLMVGGKGCWGAVFDPRAGHEDAWSIGELRFV